MWLAAGPHSWGSSIWRRSHPWASSLSPPQSPALAQAPQSETSRLCFPSFQLPYSILFRGWCFMLCIFSPQFLKCKKRRGAWTKLLLVGYQRHSFWNMKPDQPLHLSLPLPQHITLNPTRSQFSRWTECNHIGQVPASFDLSKTLTLSGMDP